MKQLQKTAKLLCWPSKRNNYKRQRNYCVNLLSETITKDSDITVQKTAKLIDLLRETITKDSEITVLTF